MLERPPAARPRRATSRAATCSCACAARAPRPTCAELLPYIREMRPVLIGVDGGADALLRAGLKPDVIVGDFDSVTDRGPALRRRGSWCTPIRAATRPAPSGWPTLASTTCVYESPGVSEDVAMLLAWELGAELIVAVGTHVSMEEFLDKGRAGMASTFLTRLLLGSVLVDAKGVSRLYASRLRKRDLAMFLGAALLVFVVAFLFLPQSRVFAKSIWFLVTEKLRNLAVVAVMAVTAVP